MKPSTTKRRLLQLAYFLENEVPSEHFNFSTFGEVEGQPTKRCDVLKDANLCGTQACALGWAPALPFAKREGIKLEYIGADMYGSRHVDFTHNGRPVSVNFVARKLFGLRPAAFSYIFYASVLHGNAQLGATARQVASTIRDFVNIRFG